MKTYTVQIDDAVAERLAVEAAACGDSVEALIASAASELAFEYDAGQFTRHDARIQEGLAAEHGGRVLSLAEVEARLAARRQR